MTASNKQVKNGTIAFFLEKIQLKADEIRLTYIEMECLEQDGEDSSLNQWRITFQGAELWEKPIPTTVHTVYPKTFAYCFPKNIIIGGRTTPCPPNVISLDSMIPWNTSDYRYRPKRKFLNATSIMRFQPTQHHNFSHYFDSNEALYKLHQERKSFETTMNKLRQESEKSKNKTSIKILELEDRSFFAIGKQEFHYKTISIVFASIFLIQFLMVLYKWYAAVQFVRNKS